MEERKDHITKREVNHIKKTCTARSPLLKNLRTTTNNPATPGTKKTRPTGEVNRIRCQSRWKMKGNARGEERSGGWRIDQTWGTSASAMAEARLGAKPGVSTPKERIFRK